MQPRQIKLQNEIEIEETNQNNAIFIFFHWCVDFRVIHVKVYKKSERKIQDYGMVDPNGR